ncbi:type II secretion system protein XpsI [Lysobacter humi (ex Lee et al. 2017)]
MSRRRERGYTLLEVVIAFGVLALALTLLLGILTHSSRQVRWSTDAGRAALIAQSLLDSVDMAGALQPGTTEGDLEGEPYRWQLEVRDWRDPTAAGQPVEPSAPRLMHVRLTMSWDDGGPRERLVLESLRLVPAGLQAGAQAGP